MAHPRGRRWTWKNRSSREWRCTGGSCSCCGLRGAAGSKARVWVGDSQGCHQEAIQERARRREGAVTKASGQSLRPLAPTARGDQVAQPFFTQRRGTEILRNSYSRFCEGTGLCRATFVSPPHSLGVFVRLIHPTTWNRNSAKSATPINAVYTPYECSAESCNHLCLLLIVQRMWWG